MITSPYENRNYLIFPVSQLNLVNFNEVLETSAETVRKSIDGTKTFVKWDGETPSFVSSLSNTEGPYTYAEILEVLNTSEWYLPPSGSIQ
jgi:hypothetical protein